MQLIYVPLVLALMFADRPKAFADHMGPVQSGVIRRHASEVAHDRKACDHDDATACDRLGSLYVDAYYSEDGEADAGTRAHALFEKACRLGSTAGCTDLGWSYGSLVQPDESRKLKLLEQTCAADDLRACTLLAGDLDPETPRTDLTQDLARAHQLYERVCNSATIDGLGCNSGCDELAMWSFYGQRELHIPEDHAKAAKLEQRSCDAGCINSCDKMGDDYRDGDGVIYDQAAAARLYQMGCDDGFAPSCEELGKLYLMGRGVTKSGPKMKALFTRSCRLSRGQMAACESDATGKTLLATLEGCDRGKGTKWVCDEMFGARIYGSIAGRVTRGGKPASGEWVSTKGTDPTGAITDVNGTFTITHVPAGRQRIGAGGASDDGVRIDVDIVAGEQATITLALSAPSVAHPNSRRD